MVSLAVNLSTRCTDDLSDEAYSTLLAAPGLRIAFDSEYGHSREAAISEWRSRLGGVAVGQASAPLRPAWSGASTTGRIGITFAQASSQYLVGTTSLAALLAGTSYSSVLVEKTGGIGSRASWGVGCSADSSLICEQIGSGFALDLYRRVTSAAATQSTSGGAQKPATVYSRVATYNASALQYNSWIDGAPAVVNGANIRVGQSQLMDMLFFGAGFTYPSTWSLYTGNTIYYLGIAPGVIWSAAWIARIQRAAKAVWGTA